MSQNNQEGLELGIEEYFKYHPPFTEERKQIHNQINEAALNFAKIVEQTVKDSDCKKMAFFAIQQARMFANQGATVDELKYLKKENL